MKLQFKAIQFILFITTLLFPPNNLGKPRPLINPAENVSAPQTTSLNELFTTEIGIYNQENLYPVTITNFHDFNYDGVFDSNEGFRGIYYYHINGTTNTGESINIQNYDVFLELAPIELMLPAGEYSIYTWPPEGSADGFYLMSTNENPKTISIDGSQVSYNLEFGFNLEPTSVTLSDSSTNQSTSINNIFALLSIIFLGLLSLLCLISLTTKKANLN